MIVIKVNYTSVAPVIKITYDETPVYIKTSVNNVYAKVVYGSGGGSSVWGGITGTLSSQTDLQNALNAKQNTLTLTTTGSSGASTLIGNTLNIPQYSGNPGTVTSVGLSMPSAFTVLNSPITSSGTIGVSANGTTAQYIRGDGTLATLPSTSDAINLITEVYNETGATLTKGTVVYINGGHGNLPTVIKAIATGDATSAQTFGLVREDITNMNNGYVIQVGLISNLDTQAYSDGTQLYLSSTTAGTYTSTKQYAPAHLVYIGIVVRSHPTQGTIQVKIQNGYELDELHNVSAQTPSNNDGLFYETSTTLWKNKSIATILGYTPEQPLTFSTPLSRSTNTISIPVASSSANGYLSSADWITFNGKQNVISLTTTGSSGASTFISNTLNIPTYTLVGLGGQTQLNGTGFVKVSGTIVSYDNSTYLTSISIGNTITSATAGSLLFAGASGVLSQNNSNLFWDNSNNRLRIATAVDAGYNFDVTGTAHISSDLTIDGIIKQTVTTNRQTASYTLVLSDRGKLIEMNVATANNLTVPLNSSVSFPIGTQIDIIQYGAGQTTIVATGGVTIRSTNSWLKINARYGAATLIKIASDEWYLVGNINA
jgi:hypothetical protein